MILILVYIGCILASLGGLYFLDVRVLRRRTSALAALAAGVLLAGSAEAALVGSSSSFFKAQQISASACELEGESAHPDQRRADPGKVIHMHIRDCMTTAGYAWESEQERCKEAPVATNPFCYLPNNAFMRAITGVQIALAFD